MAVIVEDGKLRLSGFVGDYYFEDGFTASEVVVALAEIDADADLEVHVNSPGGIATEGAAIHAILSARPGTTNIVVEGIAASAASLIAMAGETVTMAAGAVMMIHDPAGMTWGNSADHAKTIEGLEAVATTYARVYADKSGKSPDECREIMKAERWFTPDEAVAEGFANATTQSEPVIAAAFDYRIFAHAPQRLKTMAKKQNWSMEAKPQKTKTPAVTAAHPTQQREKSMSDKDRADQLAAENDKLKADAGKAASTATTTAADIVDICAEAGVPAMASSLIRDGVSAADAKIRANGAKEIRSAVDLARKSCPAIEANAADAFIASGLSLDQVRGKLFETMTAKQSPEISAHHQPGLNGLPEGSVDIVANMKQRVGAK